MNENSGCFFVKTIIHVELLTETIQMLPHFIHYGIVAYHIIRKTLVVKLCAELLIFMSKRYYYAELLTINSTTVYHRHELIIAMNKLQKLVSVACIDLASATCIMSTYPPVSCVCVQKVSSDKPKLSRKNLHQDYRFLLLSC